MSRLSSLFIIKFLIRLKLGLQIICNCFADLFVFRFPMSLLTFIGAIIGTTTSRAAKHFLSLYLSIRKTACWVAASTHLGDGFDFFAPFI
jgi:hypothetical protein